ncbi:hypothetical protein EVAR_87544_1 [Eumeta japonica]|uniref:Uncharacterized protein n=1 Tax=Eumeta variegata TaxID=151549 RepID=A0A4C1XPZ6_EUMVA|nr:hypothetical protein EVAR_87544_1 [Eumeta japonica]
MALARTFLNAVTKPFKWEMKNGNDQKKIVRAAPHTIPRRRCGGRGSSSAARRGPRSVHSPESVDTDDADLNTAQQARVNGWVSAIEKDNTVGLYSRNSQFLKILLQTALRAWTLRPPRWPSAVWGLLRTHTQCGDSVRDRQLNVLYKPRNEWLCGLKVKKVGRLDQDEDQS